MTRLLIASLFAAAFAGAQNWPQFRGPAASGVAENANPPVKWDVAKGENLRWKTPIPGIAVSSPIVWGDKVFLTSAVSSDPNAKLRHGLYGDVEPAKDTSKHTWKVYCLDKRSGKVLWERVAHEGVPKTKRHPKSSQASPTPATDGRVVVAHFGSEGLYGYDLDGKQLWKTDLGVLNAGWFYDPDFEWGVASSPVIYDGKVIVQADIQKNSFIAAYSLKDGKQVWRTERDEIPSWATPALYRVKDGGMIIAQGTKFARGYDAGTGKELWRLGGHSEITTPTPVIAGDLIIVTNGYAPIQPIYAVRASAAGDITLAKDATSNAHIAWSKQRGGPYTPTPVVYGDILYVVNNQGILSAYNVKTGDRHYQQRLGAGGSYSASPVAAAGRVYFFSEDGDVHVVKAGTTFELLATHPVGEVIMASAAISGDLLIVRGMQHVLAFGAKQ